MCVRLGIVCTHLACWPVPPRCTCLQVSVGGVVPGSAVVVLSSFLVVQGGGFSVLRAVEVSVCLHSCRG